MGGPPVGGGDVRADRDHEAVVRELARDQAGVLHFRDAHRDVESLVDQVDEAIVQPEVQLDGRIGGGEGEDAASERPVAEGAGRRDTQQPRRLAVAVAHHVLEVVHPLQDLAASR